MDDSSDDDIPLVALSSRKSSQRILSDSDDDVSSFGSKSDGDGEPEKGDSVGISTAGDGPGDGPANEPSPKAKGASGGHTRIKAQFRDGQTNKVYQINLD